MQVPMVKRANSGSGAVIVFMSATLIFSGIVGSVRGDDEPTDFEQVDRSQSICCPPAPKTLLRWARAPDPGRDDDSEDVIVTDRPDFTEASSTVGLNVFQVEMGYTYSHDDNAGVQINTHSYPETLYRIGLFAEWFELRIAYNYLNGHTDDPVAGRSSVSGSDDLYLGAKLWLTEQSGWLPEMTILPQMFVPSGSQEFTNDEVLPGVNWLYSWEVNDCLSVGGSTQVNRVRDETGHFYAETAQSAAMSLSLTEQLGAYAEYFGFYPSGAIEPGVGPEHYLNGGLSYLWNNDVQFDVRVGYGLNRNATDFFTGTGLSVRF
jgi:hypothetical protein